MQDALTHCGIAGRCPKRAHIGLCGNCSFEAGGFCRRKNAAVNDIKILVVGQFEYPQPRFRIPPVASWMRDHRQGQTPA